MVLLSAVVLGALLVGYFSTAIADTDFWWHLKTGQWIVERQALPIPDPFSYTTAEAPASYAGEENVRRFNLTHEWLAQASGYVLYLLGGLGLVVLAKGALLAGVCGAAGRLAARGSGSVVVGFAAALAGAPLLRLFASDRPALVSFAGVALLVWLLERYFETGRRRLLFALPAVTLVWANAHGGFFLSWVVLGAYAAGGLRLPVSRRGPLWAASLAAFVASGMNPNDFAVVETLIAYRQSYLTQTLIEWKQPPLLGPPRLFPILLFGSVAALAWRWRRARAEHVLLLAAFGAAAVVAFRNVAFLAFVGPFLIGSYAGEPLRRRFPRLDRPVALSGAGAAIAALTVTLAARGELFQLQAATWKFPAEAAQFVSEQGLAGRMFNSYEYGGYLIWALAPERQTFIDGRALNERVYRDYRALLYGVGGAEGSPTLRRQLFDRYSVDYIVMNGFESVSGVVYPLALELADPAVEDWRLLYQDAQALIFIRDTSANAALFGRASLDQEAVFEHLAAGCLLTLEHDPELANCARSNADLALRRRRPDEARRWLEFYLAHTPFEDPAAEALLRRLELQSQ